MSDLFIAAGGGGDPIGATIAAHTVHPDQPDPVIATYAWERPEVDPTPGPLAATSFTGLDRAPEGNVFTPATTVLPPAGSTIPALAGSLPARLLMLDPTQGLHRTALQVQAMAAATGGHVVIVDIGGDILTHGSEPTLCSPLVDAYTLAACTLAGVSATVYIAGPGTDGEIPEPTLTDRLEDRYLTPTRHAAEQATAALRWHPSEASALFAAAIHGTRGTVRTAVRAVPLTDVSARLYYLPLDQAVAHNPVAQALLDTRPATLEEAADLSHKITGIHEIHRERNPTVTSPTPAEPPTDPIGIRTQLQRAAGDATHVTFRFAARTLGLSWAGILGLRNTLNTSGPLIRVD